MVVLGVAKAQEGEGFGPVSVVSVRGMGKGRRGG